MSDTIILDQNPPSQPTLAALSVYSSGTTKAVTTTGAIDLGWGNVTYKYCVNTTNSTTGCTETAFTGVTTWTFTGLASPQTYYYFIKAKDGLNNS
jgi:hypothetical protein